MPSADVSELLHPLLRARLSPLGFDGEHELGDEEVGLLLEAARWAPSAGNSQPWAFVTARRGDQAHDLLVRHLAPSTTRWVPSAALVVVNIAHDFVDDSDLDYSEFSRYDLGQAVAHLTIQAQAMGLASRQFRAFDLGGVTADLRLAPGWQVASMTAIGRRLAEDQEGDGVRDRRSLEALRTDALAPTSPFTTIG